MRRQKYHQDEIVHITMVFRSCDFYDLNTSESISSLLLEAARIADMKVIAERVHQFAPSGVTAFLMLAESHLAIHTWPEQGLAIIDLLTCKPAKIKQTVDLLKRRLPSPKIETYEKVIKK